MSIRNIAILLVLSVVSFGVFAGDMLEYSSRIDPRLHDLMIIAEDDSHLYRLLKFKGGYEHVSIELIIQKFELSYLDMNEPYSLIETVEVEELGRFFYLEVDSISEVNSKFIIQLSGVNTYTYENVLVELVVDKDLQYDIYISNLPDS